MLKIYSLTYIKCFYQKFGSMMAISWSYTKFKATNRSASNLEQQFQQLYNTRFQENYGYVRHQSCPIFGNFKKVGITCYASQKCTIIMLYSVFQLVLVPSQLETHDLTYYYLCNKLVYEVSKLSITL